MKRSLRRSFAGGSVALGLAVCTGCISDATSTGGDTGDNAPIVDPTTPSADVSRVGIRRLSNAEYDSTMRDLLGVTTTPASAFMPDETAYGSDNITEAFTMTDARLEQYVNAADALVETTFADAALRGRIMVCTPSAATDAGCMGKIIDAFGARAWRRPLVDSEVARLTKVATDAMTLGEDLTGGMKQVVKSMLSSVPFLYVPLSARR